ncbi:MAG: DNA-3-methyladenine glycosylase [Candidatus Paceibacterota bacterium]|jgi:DNA-3-methyladenine glycosylase
MKIAKPQFFDRPTLAVAEDLIGCYLVRKSRNKIERFMITETEAYDGFHDLASHASKGKTPRNEIMFGPAGYWYTYFVYGVHWMLNIVTGQKGYPAAVLIRGTKEVNGPARLTKKLSITGKFNKTKAVRSTGLWIEIGDHKIPKNKIKRTKRVGVDYAGPIWANKKYRFVLG